MRTMLISMKPHVYEKIKSGEKIFEHRTVFPDEPIKAYMYVSSPVKSITGIIHLSNKYTLESWVYKYSDDVDAIKRINNFMQHNKVVMQIDDFYETSSISLDSLRKDLSKFIVPQMYYFIDNSELLDYLEKNIS